MSLNTRGKKRSNLVFVLVNDFMYFGFKPKDLTSFPSISTSDVTALGHVVASAVTAGKIRVIGAQAPKPPRVTKRISGATVGQQQTVSTYCAYPSITTAQAAGWNLIKGRRGVSLRASSANRGSLTAIATLSDFSLYCFPMNKADFEAYGAELGLKRSTNITNNVERGKLVSGSSTPYPGRASKLLAGGSVFSSFFSTAKQGDAAQAGYDIVSEEKVLSTGEPPF
ncbi:hypothetical protein [Halotia branconii]|uniref:Uncharacterized protein n=1 Tax=Halotia branconii CENA392 TaxID=1539056 RepID=A0AAJ6NSL2_9CYAN|nr:hypothetical protein [Halotia branconii]WGV25969.1 hypothetical protein QI031_00135 [Halotia branconii CENA392]